MQTDSSSIVDSQGELDDRVDRISSPSISIKPKILQRTVVQLSEKQHAVPTVSSFPPAASPKKNDQV